MKAKWYAVIPENRRPLRDSDRICCRHFNEDEIDRYWFHTINGEVQKLDRERPVLKKNTVPSKNLSFEYERPAKKQKISKSKKSVTEMALKEWKSAPVVEKILRPVQSVIQSGEVVSEDSFSEPGRDTNKVIPDEVTCEPSTEQIAKRKEIFETFYDEIFDVTLPSPLWGIHRDPEGTFAVFSKISVDKISLDRAVRINDDWKYTIQINGSHVDGETLTNLDPDTIAELLDEIDQLK